ncbi:KSR2 Kinase, partial [Nothocercus julius]|nr:KSR2 Kinase [Nothocercus julius]
DGALGREEAASPGAAGLLPRAAPSAAGASGRALPAGAATGASRLALQSKLVKYFSRQLSCKRKVALQERNAKLEGFPQLLHWFRIVDIRKEVMEEIAPGQLSLEELLEMTDDQVCATVEKFGANSEECARLNASLSCLRSVHKSGEQPERPRRDAAGKEPPGPGLRGGCGAVGWGGQGSPPAPHPQAAPAWTLLPAVIYSCHESASPFPAWEGPWLPLSPAPPPCAWWPLVTSVLPGTSAAFRGSLKPPGTPPPASRKLIHLLPGFTALHRSKSHEFQLGHRVDEAHTPKHYQLKGKKKKKKKGHYRLPHRPSAFPSLSPAPGKIAASSRGVRGDTGTWGTGGGGRSYPSSPPVASPGRFSTKYWMAGVFMRKPQNSTGWGSRQTGLCKTSMSNGAPCTPPISSLMDSSSLFSPPRLKCHNKCTKEAPPCHLLIIHRGGKSQLLPAGASTRDPSRKHPRPSGGSWRPPAPVAPGRPVENHYLPEKCYPPSFPLVGRRAGRCEADLHPKPLPPTLPLPPFLCRFPTARAAFERHPSGCSALLVSPQNEEGNEEAQESEDDFEEMNLSLLSARNFPRKASQTSIFLQEWDIPFEQLEIGELIGKGRFGQVFHGRWHGEVAIRLIDIERDNEDQLKAFKREVMAYRQTRHENVVLFMGACMSPPHLAIITSLCKGRTLYSVVRDAKIVLDVNKTRQIAQEIVKGMGYLHAKGILHKDLKSKNVFYDNGKVVITDFGLFSISGVLQAGRRENKLRIQNGWLCHLAPEIIRQLSPDTEEDKLPFSKHSDVFALGTIWYELHAREWPFKTQPAEAIIWQVGRGMKPNLSQIGMGKEISDILLFCWAYEQEERPSFTKLMDMLEKLPKRNRRLSHPGHFWKSAE